MEWFMAAEDVTFKWNCIIKILAQAVFIMELSWFGELSGRHKDSHGYFWVVASSLNMKFFALLMSDIGISSALLVTWKKHR